MKAAAFHGGPDASFAIGAAHGHTPAIGRDHNSSDTFRSNGFGVAAAHVNQVIASTVSCLNSPGNQLLAVGKKAAQLIGHGIVCKLPRFARARGNQIQWSALCTLGYRPFSVGRKRQSESLTNA